MALISAVILFFYAQYAQSAWGLPDSLISGLIFLIKLIAPYLVLYLALLYFAIGVSDIEKKLFKSLIKRVRK